MNRFQVDKSEFYIIAAESWHSVIIYHVIYFFLL